LVGEGGWRPGLRPPKAGGWGRRVALYLGPTFPYLFPLLMLKKLPLALVYGRLGLGLLVLALCPLPPTPALRQLLATLLVVGLLTDVFDGILARRLDVATARLRRLDSSVDLVFWLCLLGATIRMCPQFLPAYARPIGLVLGAEVLTYVVSYGRFGREIALHTLFSKAWALLLAATLVQVLATGTAGLLFWICVGAGGLSRLEILAILFTLPAWAADVPSWFHARQLRRGLPIVRHRLFN
jgi:phosphatidylglycerophosphate synthase